MVTKAPTGRRDERDPDQRNRRRESVAAVVLGAVAVATVVAVVVGVWALVSDGNDTTAARPPRRSSPAPTADDGNSTIDSIYEAQEAAKAALRRDYEAAVRAGDRAAERADPTDPELAQRLTGNALVQARQFLAVLNGSDAVIRGADRDQLRVFDIRSLEPSSHAPTRAVVRTCWVSWAEQYDAKTGRLLSAGQAGVNGAEETLVFAGGLWKLTEIVEKEEACAGVSP